MISKRHYSIAIIGAALLHLAGFLLLTHSIEGGAADKGEQGIEIDLGMLGDLGSSAVTQKSAAQEIPEEEIIEEVVEPEPVTEPVQPIIEPPKDIKQVAEITVKKVKTKQPKPVKAVKKQLITSQIKAPSDEASTDAAQSDHPASLKSTTGTADALTSGVNPGSKPTYYSTIAAKLAKYKRYPKSSRKKGEEGTVLLSFTVLKSGLVRNVMIKQSSGFKKLDRAVKKMLKEASPLPPFPPEETLQDITITIPIVFKLNQ